MTGENITDKAPLLSAVPSSNTNGSANMNFTLQPTNMPPITVTMPSLFVPSSVNTNTTATNEPTSTTNDPSQFAKYVEKKSFFLRLDFYFVYEDILVI
jgi:hypothetical protein